MKRATSASRPSNPDRPLRRYSQNFLVDRSIQRRIVDALEPAADERVIEVGPGRGALTRHLIERTEHLRAIELDPRMAGLLRQDLPDLELVEADILETDLGTLGDGAAIAIIANLPYRISSPFLLHLADHRQALSRALLLLQLELADRIAAPPGGKEYGSLSVVVQIAFTVEPLFVVPPDAFRPRPKVRSRLVRLLPRTDLEIDPADTAHLRPLVKAAFGRRRKTLANAIAAAAATSREAATAAITACDLDPTARAETVAPESWLALSRRLRQG